MALWPIGYVGKILVSNMLVAKMFTRYSIHVPVMEKLGKLLVMIINYPPLLHSHRDIRAYTVFQSHYYLLLLLLIIVMDKLY